MIRHYYSILLFLVFVPATVVGQFRFSGDVDTNTWSGNVYLSVIDDYRKISGVYPEQIIARMNPDSSGTFSFSGDYLETNNRIYRIHVDNCPEDTQAVTHFNGHCKASHEFLFIANNRDTIVLPFSFDREMFCNVIATNEKADTFLKIDSLKNEMRFAFGSYRSDANWKLKSKKWFDTLHEYGMQLDEPLAELYIYAFLTDKSGSLYSHYLEDLKSNPYYEGLLQRLNTTYPNSGYTEQYRKELRADQYLINTVTTDHTFNWTYLFAGLFLISLLINLYLMLQMNRKSGSPSLESLTLQERNVLELILRDQSNKEIATALFVSVSTVKTHINNIYRKLGVRTRASLKAYYSRDI